MRSATNNWDFWTSLPEALHQVTITMSDRGIPYSYRHMHGFGSHTFSMINANNERVWVKFHLHTQQGIKNLTDQEAEAIVAKDRESHQRDLLREHRPGGLPALDHVHPGDDRRTGQGNMPYNPFDLTKVWYKGDFPLIEVGVLELNRNPENYFQDVEQAAFNPAAVVPGDRLLAGQNAAGPPLLLRRRAALPPGRQPPPDPGQQPQECPGQPLPPRRADARGRQRRRDHRLRTEQLRRVAGAARIQRTPLDLFGAADSWNFREDDCDYYTQPGKLFRLMSPASSRCCSRTPPAPWAMRPSSSRSAISATA
jgi:catalase